MKSIDLYFRGPLHVSEFFNGQPEDSDRPGVYIWGFQQGGRFIPYYVGKHQNSVLSRIQAHFRDIAKPDSTYMRLSKAYMEGEGGTTPFYRDEKFPIVTTNFRKDRLPPWFKNDLDYFSGRVTYLNNREFISMTLNGAMVTPSRDYPKSLIETEDYLSDHMSMMHVVFACFDNPFLKQSVNEVFEVVEAFCKFSLRGKTVSKSLSHRKMEALMASLDLAIQVDGAGKDLFKDRPTAEFVGY